MAASNTQMLLYLFTLRSNAAQVYKTRGPRACCIWPETLCENRLPVPRQRRPRWCKVDGLVLNDELVVRGMDRTPRACSYRSPLERTAPRASKLASLEKLGNIEKASGRAGGGDGPGPVRG